MKSAGKKSMSHAQKKLYEAVFCLVLEGPLRERLAGAAQHLVLLTPKDFAGSDRKHLKAWKQITDDLTWAERKHHGQGKIDATIDCMIDEDASKVARDILSLFVKLSGGLQ